jgi:hypothetical protein
MSEPNEPRSARDEAVVGAAHGRAVQACETVVAGLRACGWDYACVSVSVVVPLAGGKGTTPGASRFDADPAMLPTFPHHANNLRTLARELEDAHRRSGLPEPTDNYVHVQSKPRIRSCRACGCTDFDCRRCIARTGSPCFWVDADLCSACAAATPAGTSPQTMAERWRDFERECIPAEAGAMQRRAMQRAFYAGAVSLLDVAPRTPKTDAIVEECQAFVDAGGAR